MNRNERASISSHLTALTLRRILAMAFSWMANSPPASPSLQFSSDTQIKGTAAKGRPNLCDGIATWSRCWADEGVEARLAYARQIDRVQEY
jgi:hypothetical protein